MSKRDRARRRRNHAREYDEQFGPDPAQVVYAWPDGWSIRWPGSVEGLVREGTLTETCFRGMQDGLATGIMNSDEAERILVVGHLVAAGRGQHPETHVLSLPRQRVRPGDHRRTARIPEQPTETGIPRAHRGMARCALPYDVTFIEIPELEAAA